MLNSPIHSKIIFSTNIEKMLFYCFSIYQCCWYFQRHAVNETAPGWFENMRLFSDASKAAVDWYTDAGNERGLIAR